jgi:hypothetical protein
MDYVVDIHPGFAQDLGHFARHVVRHRDGVVVWRGTTLWNGHIETSLGSFHCSRAEQEALRYQEHLNRTGERLELEHREARKARESQQLQRAALERARRESTTALWSLVQRRAESGDEECQLLMATVAMRAESLVRMEEAQRHQRRAADAQRYAEELGFR